MAVTATSAGDYDVIIAGGGMVGASLALQLSHFSDDRLKVLVVESFPLGEQQTTPTNTPPAYGPSFDARSTALSYGSRLLLEPLGVWPMLSQHLAEITRIHVSDRSHFGSTAMHCDEVHWPALGYVVENAWLGNVLLAQLRTKANIELMVAASVEGITPCREHVELSILQGDDQKTHSAQLAIIADGANSGLRKKMGIDVSVGDYHQTALIANVSFRKPHLGCAYERFTDQGPMALLPLTESERGEPRSALVWCMSGEQASHLCHCSEEEFLHALQDRFGHRQGEFIRVGQRSSYPLKMMQAQEQVRSNIVVMGNAAHALHPVAGQGFNLALRDCARLTHLLVAAHQQNQSLGGLQLLQTYLSSQHFDQQKTIGFSDQLPALFSSDQLPVSILRGLGLGVLDVSPVIKSRFIHHAAGLHDGAALG